GFTIDFQDDFKPRLSFGECEQHRIMLMFGADDCVDFPVAECLPGVHCFRAFGAGWAQFPFMSRCFATVCFSIAMQLLSQVHVFGARDLPVDRVVQCRRTWHERGWKEVALFRCTDDRIRRAVMGQHLRIRPIDKSIRQAPFWTPATVSAVFHIVLVCIVWIVYGMVLIICFTVLFLTAHLL